MIKRSKVQELNSFGVIVIALLVLAGLLASLDKTSSGGILLGIAGSISVSMYFWNKLMNLNLRQLLVSAIIGGLGAGLLLNWTPTGILHGLPWGFVLGTVLFGFFLPLRRLINRISPERIFAGKGPSW